MNTYLAEKSHPPRVVNNQGPGPAVSGPTAKTGFIENRAETR